MSHFANETFAYFANAHKNRFERKWFDLNQGQYEDFVKKPFEELSRKLYVAMPLIDLGNRPKSICRPIRIKNTGERGIVKNFANLTIERKKLHRFDVTPKIHFQLGYMDNDNYVYVGLESLNGKRRDKVRSFLNQHKDEFDSLLKESSIEDHWGRRKWEQYKRFPAGYDANSDENTYLWFKNFYFKKNLSIDEVIKDDFLEKTTKMFEKAYPFFEFLLKASSL